MSFEEILSQIRARLAGTTPIPQPDPWPGRPPFPNPIEALTAQLANNGAEARVAPDAAAAANEIVAIFSELKPTRAVANQDAEISDLGLRERFPQVEWSEAGQVTREELRAACTAADVGLSGGYAALAESGTVVVASGPNRSRLVTLLPPVCIVVVRASVIVPDIFAWEKVRPNPPPANVVFISGPSKSADIEQTMAVGVHGPGRLIVIIRED